MSDAEKALLKEALKCLDDGLTVLSSAAHNERIAILIKLVHGAISVGEMML